MPDSTRGLFDCLMIGSGDGELMMAILPSAAVPFGHLARGRPRGYSATSAHLDPGDPPPLHGGHGQHPVVTHHCVALLRQPAQPGHQESGRRVVRAGRQQDPGDLSEVVQVEPAVDLGRPARGRRARQRPAPCSTISPTISSTRSSSVTMPSVPPYSSTTTARCSPDVPHLLQRLEDDLRARHHRHRVADVADARRPAERMIRGEQIPQVDHADDLVGVMTDHRVPRVRVGQRGPRRPGDRHRRGQERHVRPGHHHLPDPGGLRVEEVDDHPALDAGQRLVRQHQRTQFVLPHDVTAGLGIAAEQLDEQVGRPAEQPDDGREQPGQHRQRAGPGQRDLLAALQSEPLRGELTEHQRAERDDQRDADQGDRLGHGCFHAEADQPGGDVLRHGRRAECGRQHRRDGDADLHRGQKLRRVRHQLFQPLTVASPGRCQVLDLTLPQRDHRDLGRVEDAADHDEHQDDDDVPGEFGHRAAADVGAAAELTAGTGRRSGRAAVRRAPARVGRPWSGRRGVHDG